MQRPIEQFARLGINHHLLFPDSFTDAEFHEQTLPRALAIDGFEVVDLFVACEDAERGRREVELIRASGKAVIYNFPLLITGGLNPSSPDSAVRERTLAAARPHAAAARAVGARKAVVASGRDPGEGARAEGRKAFASFLCALCGEVGPGVRVLIEPFDRSIGKNLLIGPTHDAADVVRAVRAAGSANVGILLDMGHLPLMEEGFRDALAACGGLVEHVHLGSCVRGDPESPYYGDMHPPLGLPGGEHDEDEVADFLAALLEAGYLSRKHAAKRTPREDMPTLTIEARPYPGVGEEESAHVMLEKVKRAWSRL